jgi:predicted nucleic acid binding AN1-type Zn finger protein
MNKKIDYNFYFIIIIKMLCEKDKCSKKIPLIEWKCRCEKKFCTKHRLPEKHKCTWNFKMTDDEKKQKTDELKCINNQVESLKSVN